MGAFWRKRVETELAWEYSVRGLLAAYERALGPPAHSEAAPEATTGRT